MKIKEIIKEEIGRNILLQDKNFPKIVLKAFYDSGKQHPNLEVYNVDERIDDQCGYNENDTCFEIIIEFNFIYKGQKIPMSLEMNGKVLYDIEKVKGDYYTPDAYNIRNKNVQFGEIYLRLGGGYDDELKIDDIKDENFVKILYNISDKID